jgi:hypothetical protein
MDEPIAAHHQLVPPGVNSMARYRVVYQDAGEDIRSIGTTYTRVRVWEGERYLGAWLGLLNERARTRHLARPEKAQRYEAKAPVALALAIKAALEQGEFDAPRDVPLHPTEVLDLPTEEHKWAQGEEVMAFEV